MTLESLRKEIDQLDENLIKLIIKRMEIVKLLVPLKDTIEDSDREQEILMKIINIANGSLSDVFIESIFSLIFNESKQLMFTKKKCLKGKNHDL